ncbi:hypothetical protein LTR53_005812, partial [Teratosphaeriaceae sp. CCFEE 6253]
VRNASQGAQPIPADESAYTGYAMPLEFRMSKLGSQSHASFTASKSSARSKECTLLNNPPRQQVPQSLSLVAFKEPIYFAHLFDNFIWSSFGSPWLQLSAEGKLGPLPYEACMALSQSAFGKSHTQLDIELDGSVTYGNAVSGVRLGLSRGGRETASLLLPMLTLIMHANVTQSWAEGEIHIGGMLALLQACGPQAFQSSTLRKAFSSSRSMLITIAMFTRRRTFLEEACWRKTPWADDPESKSEQDKLVDVMSILPGLLEDLGPLQQDLPSTTTSRKRSFCSQVQGGLQVLLGWRQAWDTSHPNIARERSRPSHSARDPLVSPSDAPRSLHYSSFACAVEHSLYNAILICLLGLLHLVETPEAASYYTETAARQALKRDSSTGGHWATPCLLAPGETWGLTGPAREIVRAFEYQLAYDQRRRESALFWLFPLGLARKVLEDDTAWSSWIEKLQDGSQASRGYGRGPRTIDFNCFPLPKASSLATL